MELAAAPAVGKRKQVARVLFKGGKKKFKADVPATRGLRTKGVKAEIKGVDAALAGLTFDSGATRVQCLNLTTQGNAEQNRNGRKISMKSVMVRGNVVIANDPTTPAKDYLRAILVYDRQPNGAFPSFGDVFQDTNVAGTQQSIAYSGVNLSNASRFKILRDASWGISFGFDPTGVPATVVSIAPPQVMGDISRPSTFKWFVKLGNLETHYNSTNGGTIADITTGSLLLFTIGLQTLANSAYQLDGEARVRYTDA